MVRADGAHEHHTRQHTCRSSANDAERMPERHVLPRTTDHGAGLATWAVARRPEQVLVTLAMDHKDASRCNPFADAETPVGCVCVCCVFVLGAVARRRALASRAGADEATGAIAATRTHTGAGAPRELVRARTATMVAKRELYNTRGCIFFMVFLSASSPPFQPAFLLLQPPRPLAVEALQTIGLLGN